MITTRFFIIESIIRSLYYLSQIKDRVNQYDVYTHAKTVCYPITIQTIIALESCGFVQRHYNGRSCYVTLTRSGVLFYTIIQQE